MREIWTDSIVEENNLNQNISILRRVFGEKPGEHRFIVTIAGHGYRFVPDVKVVGESGGPLLNGEYGELKPIRKKKDFAITGPKTPNLGKIGLSIFFGLLSFFLLYSVSFPRRNPTTV